MFCDRAYTSASAGVPQLLSDATLEKPFTALTTDHPIVTAYNQKQSSLLKNPLQPSQLITP